MDDQPRIALAGCLGNKSAFVNPRLVTTSTSSYSPGCASWARRQRLANAGEPSHAYARSRALAYSISSHWFANSSRCMFPPAKAPTASRARRHYNMQRALAGIKVANRDQDSGPNLPLRIIRSVRAVGHRRAVCSRSASPSKTNCSPKISRQHRARSCQHQAASANVTFAVWSVAAAARCS